MRRYLLFLLFIVPLHGYAQMNKELNEMTDWLIASERIVLTDSERNSIRTECRLTGIDEKTLNRNIGAMKILFNPAISLSDRIRMADYLLKNYIQEPPTLPVRIISEKREQLFSQQKGQ